MKSNQENKNLGGKLAILGSRGIPARHGGFETFAERLSISLAQRGFQVTVYCESQDGGPAEYSGVLLEHISAPRLGPFTTILFDLRCLWHARKRHDVVYMLGYGSGLFCFIPRLWGTKVWINMDGIEWARSKWGLVARLWFKFMEAVSVRVPDRVIADAEAIRVHLESRRRRMRPCSVIPYGAPVLEQPPDPGLIGKWGLLPGQYDLVVCRLEPENMIADVVRGYARLHSPCPLVIVGDHTTGTSYVQELLSFQSHRIRFIGTVYDVKKLQALRYHARAYVHGHRVGGTNPSLLEAMGCGSIIIANDNMFNREVAGSIAFYFQGASDIPAVLDKVASLSFEKKIALKAAARDRIKTAYAWATIADQYCALLESACLLPVRAIREATILRQEAALSLWRNSAMEFRKKQLFNNNVSFVHPSARTVGQPGATSRMARVAGRSRV